MLSTDIFFNIGLQHYLVLGALLFIIGLTAVLLRRNVIVIMMGIELMLNAVNLTFIAFAKTSGRIDGQIMVFFVMTIAAAEAGASILHLHARDPKDGRPTADPDVFMHFLPRIKQATDAVVNITTGGSSLMSLEERLAAQIEAIKALNASGKFKCHVFTGSEVDILPDGKLDFDAGILAKLDYTVVSVHSSFRQERDVMTKRIIKAIESGHVTMLGHLTGRLLLEREGYEVDVDKVVDAAIANRVVIELNANPWRLDMDWRHWRKAAEKGLLTSINPDAHRTEQLAFYKLGVGIARKGWLTREQVVTTKPLAEMKKWLAKKA